MTQEHQRRDSFKGGLNPLKSALGWSGTGVSDTEEGSGLSVNKIVGTDNSASYQFVKRQRRRTSSRDRSRSISITVATFDYSSSGDETIYSAQGNYICKLNDDIIKVV